VSYATSRRSFLRAVGGFAATMPFIRLLERSALGDPPAGPPLRFMALRHNHGTPTEFWRPQPGFVINGPNQSLQPYDDAATFGKSWKNNLVVIDGVNNVVAGECNSGGHASTPTIWTGSTLSPTPKCESIETYLAVTKGLGNATQFPTILYGPGGAYGAGGQAGLVSIGRLQICDGSDGSLIAGGAFLGQVAERRGERLGEHEEGVAGDGPREVGQGVDDRHWRCSGFVY